jgi:hypothetical protein
MKIDQSGNAFDGVLNVGWIASICVEDPDLDGPGGSDGEPGSHRLSILNRCTQNMIGVKLDRKN